MHIQLCEWIANQKALSLIDQPTSQPKSETVVSDKLIKNLSNIYCLTCAEDNALKEDTFNTLSWMDNQMKSQHTDLLMKVCTVGEAMKTSSTIPLNQLEQGNQIFNTISSQVATGPHSKMEKLYQVTEEIRKQQGNPEDLSASIR